MPYCLRHPNTETNLACGKCGAYVCPRCMVQTPVGVRCPDCARMRRLPTFDVGLVHYARAIGAGVVSGGVLGYLWALIAPWTVHFWVANYVVLIAIAYLVGEAVSLSVNRKRSRGLGAIAVLSLGVAMIVSAFVSNDFSSMRGITTSFYGFLVIIFGAYIAFQRASR